MRRLVVPAALVVMVVGCSDDSSEEPQPDGCVEVVDEGACKTCIRADDTKECFGLVTCFYDESEERCRQTA
jgi:hypothetical protein